MEKEPQWLDELRKKMRMEEARLTFWRESAPSIKDYCLENLKEFEKGSPFELKAPLINRVSKNYASENETTPFPSSGSHGSQTIATLSLARDDRFDPKDLFNHKSDAWAYFENFNAALVNSANFKTSFTDMVMKHSQAIAVIASETILSNLSNEKLRTLEEFISSKTSGKVFNGKFNEQKTVEGGGTAFLIEQNLLLTARHNVFKGGKDITSTLRFIFKFALDENDKLPSYKELQHCLKGTLENYGKGVHEDWAIIKLEADAPSTFCFKLSTKPPQGEASPIYILGHPTGLPLKAVTVGKYAHRLWENQYLIDHDCFIGNSGSPVINIDDESVVGMLFAGAQDFNAVNNIISQRKYYKKLISNGLAGERCLTSTSITEGINNPSQFPASANLAPISDLRPYSSLRFHTGSYRMSIYVKSGSRRQLIETPRGYQTGDTEWNANIAVSACTPPGCPDWFDREIQVLPATPGVPPSDLRNFIATASGLDTQLGLVDFRAKQFVEDYDRFSITERLFAPHQYLTRPDPLGSYSLYVAVRVPRGTRFIGDPQVQLNPEETERTITLTIQRMTNVTSEIIELSQPIDFDAMPLEEIVRVVIQDTQNTPVGKGTIRHSNADNKPFDLDDL